MAVDTLGHLLALHLTPANVDDRAEIGRLTDAIQEATGESVTLAYVDQGYTGETAAKLPGSEASRWKSSNCRRQNGGSCYYPDGGWSNGRSHGRPMQKTGQGL